MIDFIKLWPGKFYSIVELQFIFNEESLYFFMNWPNYPHITVHDTFTVYIVFFLFYFLFTSMLYISCKKSHAENNNNSILSKEGYS